jgi:hypothetical protein
VKIRNVCLHSFLYSELPFFAIFSRSDIFVPVEYSGKSADKKKRRAQKADAASSDDDDDDDVDEKGCDAAQDAIQSMSLKPEVNFSMIKTYKTKYDGWITEPMLTHFKNMLHSYFGASPVHSVCI